MYTRSNRQEFNLCSDNVHTSPLFRQGTIIKREVPTVNMTYFKCHLYFLYEHVPVFWQSKKLQMKGSAKRAANSYECILY